MSAAVDFPRQIRAATRERHLALEAVVPLLRPALSLSELRDYLAKVLGFHEAFEAHLDAHHPGVLDGWHFQRRAPLLRADLQRLGAAAPAPAGEVPARDDFCRPTVLCGWLYVIEGSALGSVVLMKNLARLLPETAAGGLAFFQPYGSKPGAHWTAFQARMGALAASAPDAGAAIIAAANRAFLHYEDCVRAGPGTGAAGAGRGSRQPAF